MPGFKKSYPDLADCVAFPIVLSYARPTASAPLAIYLPPGIVSFAQFPTPLPNAFNLPEFGLTAFVFPNCPPLLPVAPIFNALPLGLFNPFRADAAEVVRLVFLLSSSAFCLSALCASRFQISPLAR